MDKNNDKKKELVIYGAILILLIIFIICNNVFWKVGKTTKEENVANQIQYLESSNITYNVPYQERIMEY